MRIHGHPLRSGLLLAMAVFATVIGGGSIGVAQVPDTTPPETKITFGPSGLSGSSYAAFAFTSSESGSTFACSLDGGAFRRCLSPTSYAGLSDGPHTFSVRATDVAGNTDPTPAERSWTVDTVAPETSILSGPPTPSDSNKASLAFASEAGAKFECLLDDRPWTACSSPKAYSGLRDGTHTFKVRATDQARNTDATPATWTWTIDAFGPQLAIERPTTGVYVNDELVLAQGHPPIVVGRVTVQARASDGQSGIASFAFEVNGVAVNPSQITVEDDKYRFSFVPPSQGEHLITARATNGTGLSEAITIRVHGIPA